MIVPAVKEHLTEIESALTPEGVAELAEIFDLTPAQALRRNFAGSIEAWTILAHGEPIAMFGVAPRDLMDRRGEFWFVGTTRICRHKLIFARDCRRFLPSLLSRWSLLENLLDHRQENVVRWAKWLGTEITPLNETVSRMQLVGAH